MGDGFGRRAGGVEEGEAAAERQDKAAVAARDGGAERFAEPEEDVLAGLWIEAVQLAQGDVDPPEDGCAGVPDRALGQR
ncbi:MAG: hypothetical protein BWZ08_02175 [candidate division BRC1 bacterium ADurb.BinA292]|nr:MAG: hypothetical protein BWZ08_02175 [candidate division BRC1 bacterium ADurb.BinA292]